MDEEMHLTPYESPGQDSRFTQVFFDTEFTGLCKSTQLISIGCVTSQGDQFYAEFNDWYDHPSANDQFIQDSVVPNLLYKKNMYTDNKYMVGATEPPEDGEHTTAYAVNMRGNTEWIAKELKAWLLVISKKYGRPIQFVSDCLAYDWVLLMDLICEDGCALNMPDHLLYIPIDICTMLDMNRLDPDINREKILEWTKAPLDPTQKHNALYDAFIIRLWYEHLIPLKAYARNASHNCPHFQRWEDA